jgi:hypothetical protein
LARKRLKANGWLSRWLSINVKGARLLTKRAFHTPIRGIADRFGPALRDIESPPRPSIGRAVVHVFTTTILFSFQRAVLHAPFSSGEQRILAKLLGLSRPLSCTYHLGFKNPVKN